MVQVVGCLSDSEPLLESKTEILEKSQSLASQSAYTFRQLWDKVLLDRPNFKLC